MDERSAGATVAATGEDPLRRLQISDNAKGFVDLLSQLSPSTPLSDADFGARFADLASLGDDHLVVVAEDPGTGRIVATGSVFIERKFLRGGGKVGHIEDVVVDAAARGATSGIGLCATSRNTPRRPAATRSSSIARPICVRSTERVGSKRRTFRWLSTSDCKTSH